MAKKDYPQIYVEYEREDTEQTTSHEVLEENYGSIDFITSIL